MSETQVSLKNATFEWEEPKDNGKGFYRPNHATVRYLQFHCEAGDEGSEWIAAVEANLADAIAQVAELNGISIREIRDMLPLILRMLKSKSEWAK